MKSSRPLVVVLLLAAVLLLGPPQAGAQQSPAPEAASQAQEAPDELGADVTPGAGDHDRAVLDHRQQGR